MARELKIVKITEIRDSEFQMRLSFEDQAFDELVESVRRHGVLVPILLENKGEYFSVVAGHRRFAAARKVGLSELPCCVLDSVEGQGWGYAFAENLFRKDLSPIELAGTIKDCLESGEWTVESLARAVGRGDQWVRLYRGLADWPEDVQVAVHTGKLSVSAAANLAAISDDVHRGMLVNYAVENGATARITAAWLQSYEVGKLTADPGTTEPVPGRSALEPVIPYTPCVICGEQFKMIDLHFTPICTGCSDVVLAGAREVAAGRR